MNAVHLTIARLTVRGLLSRRRALLIVALSIPLLGLAIVLRETGHTDVALLLLQLNGLASLLPLVALIAGTGVFGPEIDDGTILYLLSKPVGRPAIVHTKLAVATATTVLLAALPILVASLIMVGTADGVTLGVTVAALLGSAAYCAIFVLLSLLTRHAVIVGLAYALIWEGLVSQYVAGAGNLSVRQWALSAADALTAGHALHSVLSPLPALGLLVVTTALAIVWAGQRLRSLSLTGEE